MSSADLLVGAYDTHLHASPDVVNRRLDFMAAAAAGEAAGMAGLVFKDVSASTVDRAFAVAHTHPSIQAFGGIVLDRPVGGLNPLAVEMALRRGARLVWMPVVDARNTIERVEKGHIQLPIPPRIPLRQGLTVIDEDGILKDEVVEILRLVAEFDAVLATGHLAPRETLVLLARARALGVQRTLVTHPEAKVVAASIPEQQAMAALGAMLEHCVAQTTSGLDALPVAAIAKAIESVGPEHCVIASDLGQSFNPPFTDGLVAFFTELLRIGVPRPQLELMIGTNPRRLLE